MKLYATLDNEGKNTPAKKGSNVLIRITLTAKNKKAGLIEMRLMNDEKYAQIVYFDPNKDDAPIIIGSIATGEKQKGERVPCKTGLHDSRYMSCIC